MRQNVARPSAEDHLAQPALRIGTLDQHVGARRGRLGQEGGTEIEEVAEENPDAILKAHIDASTGLGDWQCRQLAFKLGLSGAAFKDACRLFKGLYKTYLAADCSMLEINPVIITNDRGKMIYQVNVPPPPAGMSEEAYYDSIRRVDMGQNPPIQFEEVGQTIYYAESVRLRKLREAMDELIESFISEGCEGIAVSAPNPDAISDALAKADEAGIAIVTMNSGSKVFKDLGAFTHVGQDEFIAGQEAGLKFKEAGKSKVLCPIQEQNNIGLQERCDGAADTFGNVENLQLSAGLADIAQSQAEIQAKLEADPDIDAVFALNADIATQAAQPAAEAVGRDIMIGTVDLSGEAVQSIADGDLAFAIDQQQYAQGYMSVVLLYLNLINGHELGGGQPVYTGPGFVLQENAELVQELAANGTR